MNARFFDVKKSKQDSIINAALKIFSQNGYKKASTDVIVKEAGISKGLLFHYFISKKGLYEFICDYSVKYMTLELTRAVKKSENDFFKVQVQIERARTRVMKNYPYMQQFLNNMKFETDKDAVEAIGNKCSIMAETYNSIYCQTDNTRFLDKIDVNRIIDMLSWMSDGFIRDRFQNPKPDMDSMSEEFERYLNMLRRHFYKSPGDDMISIAREEMVGRDDSVMNQMKMDATFEERLEAGKQPQFEASEEETENTDEADVDSVAAEEPKEAAAPIEEDITLEETQIEEAETVEETIEVTAEDVNIEEIDAYIDVETGRPLDAGEVVSEGNEDITDDENPVYEAELPEIKLPSWWTQSAASSNVAQVTDSTITFAGDSGYVQPDNYAQYGYSQPDGYAMNGVYGQNDSYMQPVYDQNDSYFQSDNYGQQENYIQTDSYGQQEDYIQTDSYGRQNTYAQDDSYIQSGNYYPSGNDYYGNESEDDIAPPVMAEIPVPAEILHTTAVNEDDDDDEPWTPRPVRQIRL